MKYSFKSYCSYFLFFFLCACGVKGPLFLPPPSPMPTKPSAEEPVGKLYPIEKVTSNQSAPESAGSNDSKPTSIPSDNMTTFSPTIKN